jgi:hypothetical protein
VQLIAVAKGLVQYPPAIRLTFLSISSASPTGGFTAGVYQKRPFLIPNFALPLNFSAPVAIIGSCANPCQTVSLC